MIFKATYHSLSKNRQSFLTALMVTNLLLISSFNLFMVSLYHLFLCQPYPLFLIAFQPPGIYLSNVFIENNHKSTQILLTFSVSSGKIHLKDSALTYTAHSEYILWYNFSCHLDRMISTVYPQVSSAEYSSHPSFVYFLTNVVSFTSIYMYTM